jgi:hypothetical protein
VVKFTGTSKSTNPESVTHAASMVAISVEEIAEDVLVD